MTATTVRCRSQRRSAQSFNSPGALGRRRVRRRDFRFAAFLVSLSIPLGRLASPAAPEITSGLVAYYPRNGTGADLSGHGRDASPVGVVSTNDRFGVANGACFFNGGAYFVTWADGLPTGERSVAMWARWDATAGARGIVPIAYGGGVCGSSWLQAVYSTSLTRGSHCAEHWMIYPYEGGEGIWHHWVVTTSPQGSWMYLDGELVGFWEFFVNTTTVAGKDLAIGACVNPDGIAPYADENVASFYGAIDEVRIYDRALTLDEVIELRGAVPTDVGSGATGPEAAVGRIESVAPNPSRSGCEIRFYTAETASVGAVVCDIGGRVVAEIPRREFPAGPHVISWDGRNAAGELVSSGVFFARLSGAGDIGVKRLVVLR